MKKVIALAVLSAISLGAYAAEFSLSDQATWSTTVVKQDNIGLVVEPIGGIQISWNPVTQRFEETDAQFSIQLLADSATLAGMHSVTLSTYRSHGTVNMRNGDEVLSIGLKALNEAGNGYETLGHTSADAVTLPSLARNIVDGARHESRFRAFVEGDSTDHALLPEGVFEGETTANFIVRWSDAPAT